jgi:Flp pilus assembly protein TadD
MNRKHDKFNTLLICLLLGAATFIAFEQVRRNEFLDYDDNVYITKNQHVQNGLNPKSIEWAFTTTQTANWHPLTWLSHIIDCQLFGLDPKWHHLVNLLFHTANTLLLFWVLKDMTGAVWQSAFVAALFALHPLHVESVAWAAERKDVLSTMFWFLTMAAYLRYARRHNVTWYMVTLLTFALGLMAKPMLVTLPFVLLLLDYWPLDRLTRHTIFEKLPFFAFSVISSIVAFFAQQSFGATVGIDLLPLRTRLANAVVSYLMYISKMIWPSKLAVLYLYQDKNLPVWSALGATLVLATVSILAIRLAPKRRYLAVGWFWYLGTLVPVIGLVQVGSQSMADRYTYVPLVGLFIIVAWGLQDLLAGWRHRSFVIAVLAPTTLFILSICTYLQVRHWRNTITIFTHTIRTTGENIYAHYNLGIALASQGRVNEAIYHYREAIRIRPDHFEAYSNLGNLLSEQGKPDEAVSNYRKALEIRPDDATVRYNLGTLLAEQGKFNEAIDNFRQTLKSRPDDAEAYNNLGNTLLATGRLDEAITYYRQALHFKPDWPLPLNNIARILITQPDPKKRNPDEAVKAAERAAELTKHGDATILETLAAAYAAAGRFNEAVTAAQAAMELASAAQNKELSNRIRRQLELYRQAK